MVKTMNQDNIVSYVPRITLVQKMSKAGNAYNQITLHFLNDYQFSAFVNQEQLFAIKDALKQNTNSTLLDSVDNQNKSTNAGEPL